MSNILVTRSSMPSFDEYCDEIRDIWESHWLTNMGAKHKKLQKELEKYLDIPHVALYTNGHLALENAIAALNLPKGGEVITTPFTFASTTHAIVRNGLVPVFCDIKEDDYTIDIQKLENLITDNTVAIVPVHVYGNMCDVEGIDGIANKYGLKVIYDAAHAFGVKYKITDNTVAIVPVHVYGNMCDVEGIDGIANKYGLKVIYDAAHAFGVKYKGVSSACFGDASMFSFHATKVFNTIEGGCVCFKNDAWVQLLNDMKNFGIHGPESVQFVGGNAKMNEFQAAMGICNLRHLDAEILKRKTVVEHYKKRLEGVDGIKLCKIQRNVDSNYAYFPVVFDGYKYTRNEIFEKLAEVGIGARKYFYPLTNSFECYRNYPTAGTEKTPIAQHIALRVLTLPLAEVGIGARKYFYPLTNSFECYRNYPTAGTEKTPIAQHIALRVLTLPLYADLSLEDVDRICDVILE